MLHLFEPIEASPAAFAKVYILTLSQIIIAEETTKGRQIMTV
jgi:hypothetical protein